MRQRLPSPASCPASHCNRCSLPVFTPAAAGVRCNGSALRQGSVCAGRRAVCTQVHSHSGRKRRRRAAGTHAVFRYHGWCLWGSGGDALSSATLTSSSSSSRAGSGGEGGSSSRLHRQPAGVALRHPLLPCCPCTLCPGSVAFNAQLFREWFFFRLRPFKHFIPIK